MAIEITDDGATILVKDTVKDSEVFFNKGVTNVKRAEQKILVQDSRQLVEFKFSDVTIPLLGSAELLADAIEDMLETSTASVVSVAEQSSDATIARIEDTDSSTTIIAANADRILCMIHNDSDEVLRVKYGATATSTDYTEAIESNQTHFVRTYTGIIDGIWDADSTGGAQVTEVTR